MTKRSTTTSMLLVRSLALGLLLSLLAMYLLHVFGHWKLENYRPDPETTSSVVVYNTCALFGEAHTLRPNYTVPELSDRIDKTKLAGSFMNFFDGHIMEMLIIATVLGLGIFAARKSRQKRHQNSLAL